jgi:hypothetical protein
MRVLKEERAEKAKEELAAQIADHVISQHEK